MKTTSPSIRAALFVAIMSALLTAPLCAKTKIAKGGAKPTPDLAAVKYGPHERNVLDLWKAKSEKPTPLVVFIHGGGFRSGSKEKLSATLLESLLGKGISVMAINYRLSPEVTFPSHYMDSAHAVQLARARAGEWNIDPKRIGSTGGSAGAGTSLWIGFHDDMADPKNPDPVLRESTRLNCMAVTAAQSSYDPRVIKEWVGKATSTHPALAGFYGLKPDELDTPKAHQLYEAASPINYLTADDPPVYAAYGDAKPGEGIHNITFGLRLKERMDALHVECTIRSANRNADLEKEMVEFFAKHLLGDRAKAAL